jgi:hypothetical protein
MAFGGDVTFGSAAALEVEIGGPAAGSGHDQVTVAGEAGLDGALKVSLIGGYVPAPGDVYDVLTSGWRSGQFAAAAGLDDLAGLAGLDFALIYAADRVSLYATAVGGDANLDARVDYLDLGILATHYNGCGLGWSEADFNGDGCVDYLDLGILATQYGYDGTGAADPEVPEPLTICLLLAGGLTLIRRRKN